MLTAENEPHAQAARLALFEAATKVRSRCAKEQLALEVFQCLRREQLGRVVIILVHAAKQNVSEFLRKKQEEQEPAGLQEISEPTLGF